jgi:nucleolar GTP-binding protein
MVVYNFKSIQVVPTAKDFIDIILSKTQRKTPTEVHKHFKISRIRSFYMRKVKFTAQNYHEKLSQILTDFPVLDDIHPFYADLMNVLYDRDHYKLALGQLNTARSLIDNLGKDYARLLKYGDSLYRCKQLKRAGLGRMCTLMKKQGPNLAYLEQVRQHMARLPSIDPNARTIIICGYPNVGKSSFMNKVTRANVDVQPYAFTTKSLFIGHTDHRYLRWQIMDTPGILDHPLEERNTIEMQSITALAHLKATILFIVDISEHCGFTIQQQLDLFQSIKPLFTGKPLVLALNKIDVLPFENLDPKIRENLEIIGKQESAELVTMSTLTEEGICKVKELCCDKLLELRVEMKLNNATHMGGVINRLHLAVPQARDDKLRPAVIPTSVFEEAKMEEAIEEEPKERGVVFTVLDPNANEIPDDYDPTVFEGVPDYRERYLLKNEEWKFDPIPEIMDGMNVADYVDPDIMAKLEALEREEEQRLIELESRMEEIDYEPLTEEEKAYWEVVQKRKELVISQKHEKKTLRGGVPVIPRTKRSRTIDEMQDDLKGSGKVSEEALKRARSTSRSRSASHGREPDSKKQRTSSKSRDRSQSQIQEPKPGEGFKDLKQKIFAEVKARRAMRDRNAASKKGEGDHVILNLKPKHLFAGKRTIGKTQRR